MNREPSPATWNESDDRAQFARHLRRQADAVYLACEADVAMAISESLKLCADLLSLPSAERYIPDAEAIKLAMDAIVYESGSLTTEERKKLARAYLALERRVASSTTGFSAHDWQPDGGVLKFESHPGGEAPHVHTTCSKCGGRAWFTELQWEMLGKGCSGIKP